MKGIIIVNAHTHSDSLDYQPKRLKEEFNNLGCEIDVCDNDFFPVAIDDNGIKSKLTNYDFCIYLDKDIHTLYALEESGIKIFNNYESIRDCDDKALTYIRLNGLVSVPKTIFGALIYNDNVELKDEYISNIEKELKYPFIVKINKSSQGMGVVLVKNRKELIDVMLLNKTKDIIFQEYIEANRGTDIRVIVVGNEVVGAIKRMSNNDYRSNIASGGHAVEYPLDESLIEKSKQIVNRLGLCYAGIDYLINSQGEYVLCEVNSNAFFKTFEEVTKINIAEIYVKYVLAKI